MHKFISPVFLLLFMSFQTFQLLDETGDAVATVRSIASVVSQKSTSWTAVPAPYDDEDASFPLITGQSLTHGSFVELNCSTFSLLRISPHFPLADALAFLVNDRSPPHRADSETSFAVASWIIDRLPARTLAPPLA